MDEATGRASNGKFAACLRSVRIASSSAVASRRLGPTRIYVRPSYRTGGDADGSTITTATAESCRSSFRTLICGKGKIPAVSAKIGEFKEKRVRDGQAPGRAIVTLPDDDNTWTPGPREIVRERADSLAHLRLLVLKLLLALDLLALTAQDELQDVLVIHA